MHTNTLAGMHNTRDVVWIILLRRSLVGVLLIVLLLEYAYSVVVCIIYYKILCNMDIYTYVVVSILARVVCIIGSSSADSKGTRRYRECVLRS